MNTPIGHDSPSLLFLAWPYPPLNAPASVRSWNLSKGLARLGWTVNVVTPDPALWRHAEDLPYVQAAMASLGLRAIYTGHRWTGLAPGHLQTADTRLHRLVDGVARRTAARFDVDYGAGWSRPALAATRDTYYDVILATGSPFSSFSIARKLSQRSGRPYVLDYRDPWTYNPHVERRDRTRTVAMEQRIARNAAAVTAVSPTIARTLQQRFSLGARVHVVTNGFDPEDLAIVSAARFDDFAIVYTGDLYPPLRVLDPVFAALGPLARGNAPPWTFHYYGGHDELCLEAAHRHGLESRVRAHGRVTRREALAAIKGARLSVVVASVGDGSLPQEKGIITSKIFDSLGLGTPTLVVAPPGSDVGEVVDRAGLAVRFSGSECDAMSAMLARLINGETLAARDLTAYSWPRLAAAVDGVLRSAMQGAARS